MTETTVKYTLTRDEAEFLPAAILDALNDAARRGTRITAEALARRFGYKDDRAIRLAIRELIAQGHPIASSVRAPYGYWIVQSTCEAEECDRTLRSRAAENLGRLRDFRRAVAGRFGPATQLPLAMIEQALRELER